MPAAPESSQPRRKPLAPVLVGLAMFLFFPLGLYLLWRHPTLGKNAKWWASGIAWACLLMLFSGREEKGGEGRPEKTATTSSQSEKPEHSVPEAPRNPPTQTTQPSRKEPIEQQAVGKSANEISAKDLVELGNSAAIRQRFADRFVVTGRVIKVEDEQGEGFFGKSKYMVSLVGTLNSRGLANRWVECVMSTNGGLDIIGPGHFVKIEGALDRFMGSVVYMKNCCLSKDYHSY